MTNRHENPLLPRVRDPIFLLAMICLLLVWQVGCLKPRKTANYPQAQPCQTFLEEIEYPDLCDESGTNGDELLSGPPLTISNFQELDSWMLTLDECVVMALQGSKVMQRLGGIVVTNPQAVTTLYDPALQESNPQLGAEAALSDFDAQFSSRFFLDHVERTNNFPAIIPPSTIVDQPTINSDLATFQLQLQKIAANGASFTLRSQTDYDRSELAFPFGVPLGSFASFYNILHQVEVRQPLGRGFGTLYNQIAGPNAVEGQYNGVLIGRIRGDITLADFEAGVRDLVRDVEQAYWELFFAFRDLDNKIKRRDAARATWENRELRMSGGIDRPDEEAQARQQYFDFERQVVDALAGFPGGTPGVVGAQGVIASERRLRRLLGLPVSDGRMIRPATEPAATPIVFDWEDSQAQTLGRRVELRRQKWTIRQRELELIAAREINRWQFDVVGQYGFKGFGDNWFGNNSAFENLTSGELDDWQLGVEFGGPIGLRRGHLAVRNAELNLNREKAILKEQQRQLLHDLSEVLVEVDRSFAALKASVNARIAIEDELQPKLERARAGQDQIFFLLDVQQRLAATESQVYRAITDYNQALLQHAFVTGSLLSRYNIYLTEGPWSEDADQRARIKAARTVNLGPNRDRTGLDKLSYGPYDQELPGPIAHRLVMESPIEDDAQAPPVDSEPIPDTPVDGSLDQFGEDRKND